MRDDTQSSVIIELLRSAQHKSALAPKWLGSPGGVIEKRRQVDIRYDGDEVACIDIPTSGSSLIWNLNKIRQWLDPAKWFMARAQDTPNLTLYVEPGVAYFGSSGSPFVWPGGNSPAFSEPTSGSRIDVLYYDFNTSGLAIQQGTGGSILPPEPTHPSSGSCLNICEVWMGQPSSGSIFNECTSGNPAHHIDDDIRPFLGWATGGAGDGDGGSTTGSIVLTARGGAPRTDSGCGEAAKTEIGTTNYVDMYVLPFDNLSDEYAQWGEIVMPSDWNGGTITARFVWTSGSGIGGAAETVCWGLRGRSYGDDEAIDQALGTAQFVTDTWSADRDVHISAESSAITLAGTPAARDLVHFEVQRDVSEDDLGGDAWLISTLIEYTKT